MLSLLIDARRGGPHVRALRLNLACIFAAAVSLLVFGPFADRAVASEGQQSRPMPGVDYLERLAQPGGLPDRIAFVPPSKVDPAYSHVIYVNAATRGPAAQKMWVLERAGRGWRTALWDAAYWEEHLAPGARPPYSWPVSTGRKYPGEARSGPTPLGVFNMDDRNSRHRPGWGSPGMWNSIYIDLHYGSGRASGVAMHGTTKRLYRNLGRADSHGCVRMRQSNADQVWSLVHPGGAKGASSPLWGRVPRYFRSSPSTSMSARRGYVRDGSFLYENVAAQDGSVIAKRLEKDGYTVLMVFFRDDLS